MHVPRDIAGNHGIDVKIENVPANQRRVEQFHFGKPARPAMAQLYCLHAMDRHIRQADSGHPTKLRMQPLNMFRSVLPSGAKNGSNNRHLNPFADLIRSLSSS